MSREVKVRPVIDEQQYYKAFELTDADPKTHSFSEALEMLLWGKLAKKGYAESILNLVYIGSPLIMAESRCYDLADEIAKVVSDHGFTPYLPQKKTQDPDHDAQFKNQVYEKNTRIIRESAFSIFEVTSPSHGVGMEIEHAYTHDVPLIILKQKGARLSKMVRDVIDLDTYIEYEGIEELKAKLGDVIGILTFTASNAEGGSP